MSTRWLVLGLLPAVVSVFTACAPYGAVRTWVTFDPEAERFSVHARIEQVSAAFFDCNTADRCANAIGAFLNGESPSEATRTVWGLAEEGAESLRVSIEVQGDAVAVLVWYDTWPGTEAARRTGVSLERESKPGKPDKLQTRLVVDHDDRRELVSDPKARTRVRYEPVVSEDGAKDGVRATQSWVLDPKVTRVIVEERPAQGTAAPSALLAEVPGLADALRARGMMP